MNLKILYHVIFSSVHLRACLPIYSMYHSSQFIDIFSFDFHCVSQFTFHFYLKGPFLCEHDLSCILSCLGVPSLFTDGSILFQFYFCSIDCCSVNFEKIFIKKK